MPLLLGALSLLLASPQDAALLERGRELLRRGETAEAERIFEEATALSPESPRAHYYLGVSRLRLGRPREAVAPLERARELSPSPNPAVLFELGSAYLRTERFQDAGSVLAQAARGAPEDSAIRLQLGFAHYKLLEAEPAKAEFGAVLRDEPANPLAHFYLGLTEAALGNLDASAVSFRRALELEPDFVDARLGLARTLSQAGRDETAERELEELLRSHPRESSAALSAHNELGLIALRAGDSGRAASHFEVVLAERPDDRQAAYNLSLLYARLGREAEASEMRRRFEASKDSPVETRSLSRTSSKKNPR